MKAIQFKKTDCESFGNNCTEINKEFGGSVEFTSGIWNISKIAILKTNDQELYIRLGDWILKKDGVLVILTNDEYQLLQSEQAVKDIREHIDRQIRVCITRDQRQGGMLSR